MIKFNPPSDSQGQRTYGPNWTVNALRNHAWNSGLPSELNPEVTTARGKRRKERG